MRIGDEHMRIFYITNARIPTEKANGYQTMATGRALAAAGAELELVVPRRRSAVTEDPFRYYGFEANFPIRYLPTIDLVRLDRFSSRFRFYIQYLSFLASLFFLAIPRDAIVYTRELDIAVIAKLKRRRTVVELHRITKWTRFLRFADRFVTVTGAIRDRLVSSGVSADRILVAPDGVDLEVFAIDMAKDEARKRLALPPNKKVILYTGNFLTMGEDKGIDTVLRTLQVLPDRPEIVFIADGGKAEEIRRYAGRAAELGVADRVTLQKRVPLNILAEYQRAADILLMPFPDTEHYRYYMSPLKMFEYMASGRPIIASDLPAVREVLDDTSAYFVRPGDANELSRVTDKVFSDPASAEVKADKARAAAGRYSWEARAGKILRHIR